MIELKYPLFDGTNIFDGTSILIENGQISSVTACADEECSEGFLMPGLIDAHVHLETMKQAEELIRNGITAACDVSASQALVESSKQLAVISSGGMAVGMVMSPHGFVENAIENGACYIKVLLFNKLSIGKSALRKIVQSAHAKGLKVAVHATEVATVRQAVDAEADILLHVPLKEEVPVELAKMIASKGIAVAPTLVMMETFANSGKNGYQPEHYKNAEKAVKLLHESGVQILAATDANSGSFAPPVAYGTSLHHEMELLVNAGMTPIEVLTSATSKTAEVFGISQLGTVKEGKKAALILIDGRPDKTITDTTKIKQIWIDGKPIL